MSNALVGTIYFALSENVKPSALARATRIISAMGRSVVVKRAECCGRNSSMNPADYFLVRVLLLVLGSVAFRRFDSLESALPGLRRINRKVLTSVSITTSLARVWKLVLSFHPSLAFLQPFAGYERQPLVALNNSCNKFATTWR